MLRVTERASFSADPVGAARAKYNEIKGVLSKQGPALIDIYERAVGIYDHASQREFRTTDSKLLKDVQSWKEKASGKISKSFGEIIKTSSCNRNSEVILARNKFEQIKSLIDKAYTWEEFDKASDLMDEANSFEFRPEKRDREVACLIYGYKREASWVIEDLQTVLLKNGASKNVREDDEMDLQFVEDDDDLSASSISRQSSVLSAVSRQSTPDSGDN